LVVLERLYSRQVRSLKESLRAMEVASHVVYASSTRGRLHRPGWGDVTVVHMDAALTLSVQTVPLGNLELDIALWIAGAVLAIENSN